MQYYRLAPFKPSRDQLIRYQGVMGRIVPMTKDKKTGKMKPTMDEKAIEQLSAKHPEDPLYPLVLLYREIDKIAGTYVGRIG
jgi:DNA polymerase I-like protein with 3'-5' exonuclease and polymerase domains